MLHLRRNFTPVRGTWSNGRQFAGLASTADHRRECRHRRRKALLFSALARGNHGQWDYRIAESRIVFRNVTEGMLSGLLFWIQKACSNQTCRFLSSMLFTRPQHPHR